ncbi:MAG TPA: hypothetical protein PKW33_16185 [Anaerolineaceae bacterium]|nr:hypothetical protein [Anaerolineaceae bacterium]HPN53137.1 hypothetical protein [Anaerolineaceae bacterium]
MKFDFTAAEQFIACMNGQLPLGEVLTHPAYQTVGEHARLFGQEWTEDDVRHALTGSPSPFYGLKGVRENLARIQTLLSFIQKNEAAWINVIEYELGLLFPGEEFQITIYPIIGYDMGIGLNGNVCMNCNIKLYMANPVEFMFYIIHECAHIIYERYHRIKPLDQVVQPADWYAYFGLWLQNEGIAVYAPLRLRREWRYLLDRDYRVLTTPMELEAHRLSFVQALEKLKMKQPLSREEYMGICFGEQRLTYRIGCAIYRKIENQAGLRGVQEAFLLDGETFLDKYQYMMKI